MMLVGPILPTILTLAAPNVLNVAMQSLVSVSDSWFVSQLGLVDLAALALVFPTQMALGQMSAGAMGGGVSSSVARALGSGNRAAAEAAAAHALVIALGMAALFAVVLVGFGRPIYGALGGSGRALDGAVAYASVLFLGCGAHWIANTLASVLRGTGDMKTPGYALVATAALQIPLTGALTLGWFGLPKLGIVGPAAAAVTVFTPRCALDAGAAHRPESDDPAALADRRLPLALVPRHPEGRADRLPGRHPDQRHRAAGHRPDRPRRRRGDRGIRHRQPVGVHAGADQLRHRRDLTALVGTNIGAKQFARAQRVAWSGALIAGGIAATIGIVVAIEPDLWLRLFTNDPAALASGRTYLSIVGPVYGFFGLAMALYFASQGTGEMVWPVIANLCRILIAVCGSLLALDVMGWGLRGLFTFVALGIVCFSAVLAFSTTRPAWRAP